jgi:hypothetical protein
MPLSRRVSVYAATLALVAAPAPISAQQTAARPTDPTIQGYFRQVRGGFSGDRALAVTAFVEKFWRVPGNAGFDASIRRVAALLDSAGFVPQERATAADRLTYRVESRPMSHPTWEPVDASLSIVGRPGGPLLRWATNRNMLSINSFSTPAGGVDVEVVDVGAGRPEDFAGKDVRGKAVFGAAGAGTLARLAIPAGAAGVLSYSMPAYTQPETHPISIQFSTIPLDPNGRAWGISLSHAAYTAMRETLSAGPVRVHVAVDARSWRAPELTLVADVRGAAKPDERFVYSAHVQEPGANDNASGVGTLAEMARVTAGLVRSGEVNPGRSLTFIWGDEITAPRRYLAEDAARATGVRWGLSLDMVGEDTRKTGGTFLIEKMPDPSAIWTRGDDHHSEWGGEALEEKDLRPHYFNDFVLGRALDQGAMTGWTVRTNPFEGGSDHTPFLDAGKPGLLFWHFTDVYYHTDADRLEMVSPAEMTNSGVSALVAGLTLTSADGATARFVVGEIERAAVARLATEARLSAAAIAAGGDRAHEAHILATWTKWYADALRSADDIETGGSSAQTRAAIAAAVQRVEETGDRYPD